MPSPRAYDTSRSTHVDPKRRDTPLTLGQVHEKLGGRVAIATGPALYMQYLAAQGTALDVHYRKTFLKQVILRLDYGRIAALMADQETPFTVDMRERYSEVTPLPAMQLSFVVGGAAGVNFGPQNSGWVRLHKANEEGRTVTLAPDYLAIEYVGPHYKHFEELEGQIEFVLDKFRRYFGVNQFTRIGLRYVNEVVLSEGAPLDWDGWINPTLVTAVKAGLQDDFRMARSAHQLTAVKGDIAMILNYGIYNPDFPNPVARRQFVLDLDCYVSGAVESRDAETRIKDVNKLAEKVFEHSIGDRLRDEMEVLQ